MIQALATLLFLLVAAVGVAVIAASLIEDWGPMTRALGFGGTSDIAPLPLNCTGNARQTRAVRVTHRLEERRAVAA